VSKKKLLILTSTFPRWKGDPKPSFVYDLSKRLTKQFDVFVLAPHFPGAEKKEILGNVTVYRFKYFITKYQKLTDMGGILDALINKKMNYMLIPFLIIAEFFSLIKWSMKLKPDVIHAHWIIPQGFIAYLNYKILKIPYIITAHGSDIFKLERLNIIKKFSLRNAKRITVVSSEIKRKILKEIDSQLKIDVIPMGVDTELFKPASKDQNIEKKYGIKGPLLLFVGRVAPEKGLENLIEAMPKILEYHPESKLLIIGDGNQRKALEELSQKKNLQNTIIFINSISNHELPKYYATADIFICPSLNEGAPVTYIESLACGTPIVVGDLPISREMVCNGRGVIVKQKDPNDIARKILISLNKNICKDDLFRYIQLNYDWEVISDRFISSIEA